MPRTKFLLCKAPVSTLYEEKYGGDRNIFTADMYYQRMIAKKFAIGLVIDCTSLDLAKFQNDAIDEKGRNDYIRYFHNTDEWEDFGIDYHRLSPSSKDESSIPSREIIDKFHDLCSNHWKKNPTLHITLFDSRGGHGVASFLAATYLCKQKRAPVHAALSSVERAFPQLNNTDPSGLFDIDLTKELQTLYQGKTEIILKVKDFPKWWSHDDPIHEEEAIPPYQESSSASTGNKRKPLEKLPEAMKKIKTSTEDASTVLEQLSPQSRRYDRATSVLQQLLGQDFDQFTKRIRDRKHLNLTKENMVTHFCHKNYKVSWRSIARDGLLLILSDGVFFIESKEDSSRITIAAIKSPLYFPEPQNVKKLQHRTLLNVNLVTDRESNREVKRMYISDILVHMGGILIRKPFDQRIKFIIDMIIIPRKKSAAIWSYKKECIMFRAREFFDLEKIAFVMKDVTQGVGHATNGIYFISTQDTYFGDPVLLWDGSQEGRDDLLRHVAKLPSSK